MISFRILHTFSNFLLPCWKSFFFLLLTRFEGFTIDEEGRLLDGLIASPCLTCFFAVELLLILDDIASNFFPLSEKTERVEIFCVRPQTRLCPTILRSTVPGSRWRSGDRAYLRTPGREERGKRSIIFWNARVRPDLEITLFFYIIFIAGCQSM